MKNSKLWLKTILCLSVIVNVLFVLPYTSYLWNRLAGNDHFCQLSDDSLVVQAVVNASMRCEQDKMVMQEFNRGLFADMYNFYIAPSRTEGIVNHIYTSWNYVGLSEYALATKDSVVCRYLIDKADSWLTEKGDSLLYPLKIVDQYPIGVLFINLYKMTGKERYKVAAEYLYRKLDAYKGENDVVLYRSTGGTQKVDVLGMIVPFLMEYYRTFADSTAYNLAIKNLETYYLLGVDKDTGLPVHGYDLGSGIKLGSANWGRGIGWYLLSVAYCPEFCYGQLECSVDQLPYTQFPFSSKQYDSSTAIMCEIFKQSRDSNRVVNLDFIKPFITKDGFVDSFSGDTYGSNNYSETFGVSELGNGLLLLLCYKFGNNTR